MTFHRSESPHHVDVGNVRADSQLSVLPMHPAVTRDSCAVCVQT